MSEPSKCSPESVNDCKTIDELVNFFAKRTMFLNKCLDVRNLGAEDRKIFRGIEIDVAELKTILKDLSKVIEKCQQHEAKFADFARRIRAVDFRTEHANKTNVFSQYTLPVPEVSKPEPTPLKKEPTAVISGITQKSAKTPLIMSSLTVSEFSSVPKYMKGRLTYENVNKFIGTFNKTIAEKYKFLSTPRSQLGNTAYKTVQEMKRQETSETKGLYFCVLDDIKTFGQVKPDNATRNILTILRHFSRIKEVRGPGSIVRFVILEASRPQF